MLVQATGSGSHPLPLWQLRSLRLVDKLKIHISAIGCITRGLPSIFLQLHASQRQACHVVNPKTPIDLRTSTSLVFYKIERSYAYALPMAYPLLAVVKMPSPNASFSL